MKPTRLATIIASDNLIHSGGTMGLIALGMIIAAGVTVTACGASGAMNLKPRLGTV